VTPQIKTHMATTTTTTTNGNEKSPDTTTTITLTEEETPLKVFSTIEKSDQSDERKLVVKVENASRTALGKLIRMMNHTIRGEVDRCSMIVWAEAEKSYGWHMFACGQFTASCFCKNDPQHARDNLKHVGNALQDALEDFDKEFREERQQRLEIKKYRQIEAEQRRQRAQEQQKQNQRRAILEEARRQERALIDSYTPRHCQTMGDASLKIFPIGAPGAPRIRRFRARTNAHAVAHDLNEQFQAASTSHEQSEPTQPLKPLKPLKQLIEIAAAPAPAPADTFELSQSSSNWGDDDDDEH